MIKNRVQIKDPINNRWLKFSTKDGRIVSIKKSRGPYKNVKIKELTTANIKKIKEVDQRIKSKVLSVPNKRRLIMEAALRKIRQWALAYPEESFPKPDMEKARKVLSDAGIDIGALHGEWARHIMKGILEITEQGLKGD